jgi:hypothetical protein
MLLLLPDPRIGLGLTLEAGISSGESAELSDVDGECAVGFRDHPIISHALNMACQQGAATDASLANCTDRITPSRIEPPLWRPKNFMSATSPSQTGAVGNGYGARLSD